MKGIDLEYPLKLEIQKSRTFHFYCFND